MLRFKGSDLHAVLEEARTRKCTVAFVKDHGVYLLAREGDSHPGGKRKYLAYAIGCNPDVDAFDDWWNLASGELGGDDFAEDFDPHDPVLSQVWETGGDLLIEATASHLSLTVQVLNKPKR